MSERTGLTITVNQLRPNFLPVFHRHPVDPGTAPVPSLHRPVPDVFTESAQPWDYMNPELLKYRG